jgi:methylphosphotriester-DNA--protein-cysteine methyltransferase
MSPSHLSHVCHDVVGMPLRDCLRDIQLNRAHELLLGSALSPSTIAVDAGVDDGPHKAFGPRPRLDAAGAPTPSRRATQWKRIRAGAPATRGGRGDAAFPEREATGGNAGQEM